jgi:hypothetical protein
VRALFLLGAKAEWETELLLDIADSRADVLCRLFRRLAVPVFDLDLDEPEVGIVLAPEDLARRATDSGTHSR